MKINLYKEANEKIADLLLECEDNGMLLYAGAYIKSLEKEILELKAQLPPCKAGDYAVFADKSILPVVYITFSQHGITVGCRNGINVSMDFDFPNRCKGFYSTYEEAEAALQKLK